MLNWLSTDKERLRTLSAVAASPNDRLRQTSVCAGAVHGAGARCSESNFSEKIGNFLIQSEIFGFELWSNFNAKAKVISEFRGVVAGSASAGGATPDFGRSVNPISTRGADYAHQIILAPSNLQTFLQPW